MECWELYSLTFNPTPSFFHFLFLSPHLSLFLSVHTLSLSLPSLSPSPLCPNRKLTLENLYWSVFDRAEERENNGRQFVQLVQEQLSKPTTEVSPTIHLYNTTL